MASMQTQKLNGIDRVKISCTVNLLTNNENYKSLPKIISYGFQEFLNFTFGCNLPTKNNNQKNSEVS